MSMPLASSSPSLCVLSRYRLRQGSRPAEQKDQYGETPCHSRESTHLVKVSERLPDNLHGLHQIFLRNDQWRRKPDAVVGSINPTSTTPVSEKNSHIDMGRLSQPPPTLQQQTELPRSSPPRALFFVDDDSIEQSPTTNG